MSTDELLNMTLWQYNAYSEAKELAVQDELCLKVQAAFYNAYWNSGKKHKKTLKQVIDAIRNDPYKEVVPIDIDALAKEFKQAEELRTYGWTAEESN